MKAIVYRRYGGPEVLRQENLPLPTPRPDEVRIQVKAASVNSWDWDRLTGRPYIVRFDGGFRQPMHKVLGCDVAGIIDAVGDKVTQWAVGDAVFGDFSGAHWGGFAEYVCGPAHLLAAVPSGMDFGTAAAIPQAGVLALQGMRQGGLREGQRVLINGAGGGVGTFALQMARAAGAEVTVVDHTRKLALLRELGADHLIDYTQTDYTRTEQPYDLILDMVARRSFSDYRRALAPGGAFVIVGGYMRTIFPTALRGKLLALTDQRRMGLLLHHPNAADQEILAGQVHRGELEAVIGQRFPLAEVPAALDLIGKGEAWGKLVIDIG
ncbi:MAG: NAD(P)-dependent alcohol dehydrogenase [Lewinella sp.]|nr:NAD(P)-dependent alcohol dehydrogenase [Lewinella sp.]